MAEPKINQQAPQFEIQRIFVKDVSVEEWKPEVTLNLETKSSRIQDNVHEVVLSITATVSTGDKTAFLIEVNQAGVFMIAGFPDDQLHQMLGSFCPNVLFPYAREAVSDLVVRGGFPQLILAPVNFDALYAQHMEKQTNEAGSKSVN
jgi:preprotein translocase subunit SecB